MMLPPPFAGEFLGCIARHDFVEKGLLIPVLPQQAADTAPQHVTFATDRAYVTSGDAGILRVLTLSGRLLHSTQVPVGSYNVQHGPGLVITPSLDHGTLTVIDRHGVVLARVSVAGSCHDACFYGSLTA